MGEWVRGEWEGGREKIAEWFTPKIFMYTVKEILLDGAHLCGRTGRGGGGGGGLPHPRTSPGYGSVLILLRASAFIQWWQA